MTWLDDQTLAVEGIGDDYEQMVEGVRIFDVREPGRASPLWRGDLGWRRQLRAFAGPAGRLFADRGSLYSAAGDGLSRWDPADGSRTGHLPGFSPTHHHRGANELAEMRDGVLLRWSTAR